MEDLFDDVFLSDDEIQAILGNIATRCHEAGLSYQDDTTLEDERDIQVSIKIPSGKETRSVYLLDEDDLKKFESIEFEKYSLLGNYAAICSYKDRSIEALISSPTPIRGSLYARRVRKLLGVSTLDKQPSDLILTSTFGKQSVEIRIKPVSTAAQILTQVPAEQLALSLELILPELSNHDQAIELLIRVTNSLFFEIDLQKGIHLSLVRRPQRVRLNRATGDSQDITYPHNIYDDAPMALYWYARTASNMPLLQFLAFYQSIEYYYGVFYNAEISRKVRSIIKTPTFRADNDVDIARIVSTIRSKGLGFVSEKDQLRATLRECVRNEDIEDFINNDSDRKEFFHSKAKGITSYTLNLQNRNHELVNQVTDRIYDIRCKIVHTKSDDSDGEIELLLPYSNEAEKLGHDIELVRFIAQKVLIYSSKEAKGLLHG